MSELGEPAAPARQDVIRVLVADDEPLIRAGIVTVLQSTPEIRVTAQAADGRSACDAARRHAVDVAVVDLKMPVLDGLGAVEELRRTAPAVNVVVLTSFGDGPNVVRAVQSGAVGFVLKNCTPDELITAVRSAHRGDAYLSPAVTRIVLNLVQPVDTRRRDAAAHRLAALTPRESDVLRLVAEGLSNAEIASRLRTSETSIKTYVSRILAKLGCANRVQATLLARDAMPG